MCKRETRHKIFIEGERCCELDYSGLHIRLLYAEIGESYEEDPYTIPDLDRNEIFNQHLFFFDEDKVKRAVRGLVKLAFNMGLNASTLDGAYDALRYEIIQDSQKPESKQFQKFLYYKSDNKTLKVIFDAIVEHHPRLSHCIGDGVWKRLHYQDSCIALDVVNAFVQSSDPEPILPLHDSFLVRVSQRERLRQQMIISYEKLTKLKIIHEYKLIH
jgi:hypothetical protein